MSCRVLMVNRADARIQAGGDTIQMDKTCAALRKMDVKVEQRLVHELTEQDWSTDIVHIFNLQLPEQTQLVYDLAIKHNVPIVLSPVYWDPLPGLFAQSHHLKRGWHRLRQLVGYRVGLKIYRCWQYYNYRHWPSWRLQRAMLEQVDALLPNSKMEFQCLCHDFYFDQHDLQDVTTIVPNGVDADLFGSMPHPSVAWRDRIGDQRFVLQVGRISPEKNSAATIRALQDIEVPIVFVGRASVQSAEYAQYCYALGHKRGRVIFIDWVSHEELPSLYALAATHVLPSWRETPGLVSLEAAAAGCAVVSTTIGSAKEYFGSYAYYCKPHDLGSIRRAVVAALDSPRKPLLREHVLRNFTWTEAAKQTLRAYEQVLSR